MVEERPIGETRMRYPAGDPENGPAYLQRWNGNKWECARHKIIRCEEIDDESGEKYSYDACAYCGQAWFD